MGIVAKNIQPPKLIAAIKYMAGSSTYGKTYIVKSTQVTADLAPCREADLPLP